MQPVSASVKRPPAACVTFFADGLSQSVLKRMLAAGELPNIDRLFARGGVEVENAIVCLPSLTYANAVSLITGLFPGHHGVLGNQWFDPTTLEYRDYGGPLTYRRVNDDVRHATIYDLLNDHFTLNVQCHTRKGVKHTIDQDISSGILWGLGMYSTVDRRVGEVLPRVARAIDQEGRWPTVWMNYFPGVDEIGHRFGPDSPEYAAAVRNVDAQIARIAAFAQENAGVERLFMAFVTDHGMVATPLDRRRDPLLPLARSGIRVTLTPRDFARIARSGGSNALLYRGTDRALRLHLASQTPTSPTHALDQSRRVCEAIELTQPASVACACYRDGPDSLSINTTTGTFRVERRVSDGLREYRIPETDATRGFITWFTPADCELDRHDWHSSRAWLNATACSEVPDFVPQVCDLFDSSRTGNVVAFAAGSWSFDDRFEAGHGSCLAADMRVSHFYTGPDLPAGGRIHAARLVDVMPTLLDLLGHHDRLNRVPPIDGVSIRRELEAANRAPPDSLAMGH